MSRLWGPQRKFSTWRRLWVALAEAEAELGLPITREQIEELRQHVDEVEFRLPELKARGVKGTTGTQASFLELFGGDHAKVRRLDELVSRKMGFEAAYPVTGQTYSRKVDSQVLATLSGIAQSGHKAAT